MKRALLLILPLLGGCQWISNTADHLGSYMPVIGERCEHWQCFTESGRAQSEANKQMMQRSQQPEQQQPEEQIDWSRQ